MTAGYEHAHRGALGAIHIGQGVRLGSGLEKGTGDRDGLGRRALAAFLDAVGGDVVQQRGAVYRRIETADPAGTSADKGGTAAERLFERSNVAIDDGFDSGFEFEDGAWLRDGFDVGGQ